MSVEYETGPLPKHPGLTLPKLTRVMKYSVSCTMWWSVTGSCQNCSNAAEKSPKLQP